MFKTAPYTERLLIMRSKPYHRIRRTSGFETQDRAVSVHGKYPSYIIPAALGYWPSGLFRGVVVEISLGSWTTYHAKAQAASEGVG